MKLWSQRFDEIKPWKIESNVAQIVPKLKQINARRRTDQKGLKFSESYIEAYMTQIKKCKYSVSCQTFPLFSCQFWALKWLKFQNQPDFWKIPNLNFLVVLEFFKTIEKWKIFINGWKKQCHFFGFLNISSVSILRNPQKWHCFFQPLIKNFFWKFQNH